MHFSLPDRTVPAVNAWEDPNSVGSLEDRKILCSGEAPLMYSPLRLSEEMRFKSGSALVSFRMGVKFLEANNS